ncbi:MAG: HAD family phosphatase [Patescibacteria group bacterium]|mgnify:FL=1
MKAVIFDLDGLLLDTEPYWTEADNQILAREGYKLTPELIRKRLGIGALNTVSLYHETFPFKYSFEEFAKERRDIVFNMMDQGIPVMDGATELIDECFKKGFKIAIATTAPHRARMSKILDALKASKYITVFVTGREVERQKPFPDIFLLAAKELNMDPKDCLVLEDASSGIEAAKAANMLAYGVNLDEETRRYLKKKGADKVFSSLTEVGL